MPAEIDPLELLTVPLRTPSPPSGTAPFGITLPAQLHDPALTVFRQLGVPGLSAGSPNLPLQLYF
jgi:hypothetical protein